jgi:hypothetical protein
MSYSKIFKRIEGSICAPGGFKAASVFCDIKRLGTGKGSEKGRKRGGRGNVYHQSGLRCAREIERLTLGKALCPGNRGEFWQCKCVHRPSGNSRCKTND